MKKLSILILTLLLLVSQSACGRNTEAPAIPSDHAETDGTSAEQAMTTYPHTEPPEAVPDDAPEFPLVLTTVDELREYAEKIGFAQTALAFVTGDTEQLAFYIGYDISPDIIEPMKTVKFSEFKLTFETPEELSSAGNPTFEFTVSESEMPSFPVGEYSYTFDLSPVSEWESNSIPDIPEEYAFPYDVANDLASYSCILNEGEAVGGDGLRRFESGLISTMLFAEKDYDENYSGGATRETIVEDALAMFGIENYVPAENAYRTMYGDGLIHALFLGGTPVANEITEIREEEGTVVLTMQMFSDRLQMIPSHRIEYTFEKNDTKFGWTLIQIKCVDRGEHEPYAHAL